MKLTMGEYELCRWSVVGGRRSAVGGRRSAARGSGLGARGSGLGARGSGLGARGSGLGARGSGLGARGLCCVVLCCVVLCCVVLGWVVFLFPVTSRLFPPNMQLTRTWLFRVIWVKSPLWFTKLNHPRFSRVTTQFCKITRVIYPKSP